LPSLHINLVRFLLKLQKGPPQLDTAENYCDCWSRQPWQEQLCPAPRHAV